MLSLDGVRFLGIILVNILIPSTDCGHFLNTGFLKPSASMLVDPPNLPSFMEHVAIHIPAKHYWFGLAIGVADRELKGYSDLFRGDQLRCFESIFKYWESRLPGAKPFKWSSVVEALNMRMVGENALAQTLQSKIA